MIGNLEREFENLLSEEATRIFGKLLVIYEKKEKVNEHFESLIRNIAKEHYKYFWVELLVRINKLLPSHLEADPSGEYALVTRDDYLDQWLSGYENLCKETENKDHSECANKLSKILVKYCIENPTCNEDLVQLVARNMNTLLPQHNDSVDCRVILRYLQTNIIDMGYVITNLAPLRIKKNKN